VSRPPSRPAPTGGPRIGSRPRPAKPQGLVAAYRLLLEYEGGKFQGWQRQSERQSMEGVRTVAGSLEHAVRQAGLRLVTLMGSGRTDAGVHALGQVAHLHLDPKGAPDPRDLPRLLEPHLPGDIGLRAASACSPDFHARHDAMSRSYLYQISLRRSGLAKPFIWWVKQRLDLAVLERAWKAFEGPFDVSAFADLDGQEDPRCKIESCEMAQAGSLILLRVTASHFKRSQVRRMVGAAVACARGEAGADPTRIARDLSRPRPEAALFWSALAAPASGLFLEHVRYAGDKGPGPLVPLISVP
jgi:tRNA pseudouridine38-40 synthase